LWPLLTPLALSSEKEKEKEKEYAVNETKLDELEARYEMLKKEHKFSTANWLSRFPNEIEIMAPN